MSTTATPTNQPSAWTFAASTCQVCGLPVERSETDGIWEVFTTAIDPDAEYDTDNGWCAMAVAPATCHQPASTEGQA